jgi:uncharacterized membrane protein YkvA (DUF1232 family)
MSEAIQQIEEKKSFLKDLRRMLKSLFRGAYRVVPWRSLFLLGYILSPIDFLPEALLPVIGLADDAAVFAFLIRSLMSDVEKFREWERYRVSPTTSILPQTK